VYQMYSLQKCFDITKAPLDVNSCVASPKLDGAAVSLLYVDGNLELALTRGDGIQGRDITDKMRMLVPTEIRNTGLIQVTGEVVAPREIPNARNFAAGALGLKSLTEFSTRPLVFVAYDALPRQASHYEGSMTVLRMMGLREVTTFDCSRYPTDGVVYRLKDSVEFERLGYTSKHPRGAFALKEQAEGVETTLIDVVWQLGKSGVVSPVAILDPIEIGGATVSRATLHNIEYIRDLDLEIGCRVSVIRSGEIIPRIIGRVEK